MCDWVSGAVNGEWYDYGVFGDDCCVSAESEISSVGSTWRDDSQECVVWLGAAMVVGGFFLRCLLCGTKWTGHANLCYLFFGDTPSITS